MALGLVLSLMLGWSINTAILIADARHEGGQERGDGEAEHPGRQVFGDQRRDRVVVLLPRIRAGAEAGNGDEGDESGDHHDQRDEDLREGTNQRGALRGVQVLG
jgi:hypothetical protein